METDTSTEEDINWNHVVYMLSKLNDAIIILVQGEGDARSRLRIALPYICQVIPGMLPTTAGIRQSVEKAHAILTKYHDPDNNSSKKYYADKSIYDSTLHRIKNQTASKAISELFSAWMNLRDLNDQHYHT